MKQTIQGALLIALLIITIGAAIAAIDILAGVNGQLSRNLGLYCSNMGLLFSLATFCAGLLLITYIYNKN
jgi:hypothetical protein